MLEVALKICGERVDYLVNSGGDWLTIINSFLKNKNKFMPHMFHSK